MAALKPSPQLAAVIGDKPMPRTEITKKLWEYIKKYNLQDSANKRMINGDDKLKAIFGKPQVSMFEMTKLVSKHISSFASRSTESGLPAAFCLRRSSPPVGRVAVGRPQVVDEHPDAQRQVAALRERRHGSR